MNENHQVKVPQMGEGLQYAKVVRILKNAGDWAEEDADVVEVETEKAILGISTPVAGFISSVSCQPGDMVNVGAVLLEIGAKLETSGVAAAPAPAPQSFRQERKGARTPESRPVDAGLRSLPERQLALIDYMRISRDVVIPASLEMQVSWEYIDGIKRACRAGKNMARVPAATEIICWALARAMQKFEKFRSRLTPDNKLQVNAESLIGIAVAGEDDTLDMRCAAIAPQDSLEAASGKTRAALEAAGPGGGYHSVSLSDMSSFQVIRAQPVVIYPSVATLFIGAPQWVPAQKGGGSRCSNFVLAFDHRVLNGVYAAKFLKEVEAALRHLADQMSTDAEKEKLHAA